jgi:hypothetical protein
MIVLRSLRCSAARFCGATDGLLGEGLSNILFSSRASMVARYRVTAFVAPEPALGLVSWAGN